MDILNDDVLTNVFDELTKNESATQFVNYLFSDLLNTKFFIEDISERAVEDSNVSAARRETVNKLKAKIGSQSEEHLQARERSMSENTIGQSSQSNKRVKKRVAQLTGLIWDELYLGDV